MDAAVLQYAIHERLEQLYERLLCAHAPQARVLTTADVRRLARLDDGCGMALLWCRYHELYWEEPSRPLRDRLRAFAALDAVFGGGAAASDSLSDECARRP